MMTRRTATNRHNRRGHPHGLPASALIADQLPLPVAAADTAPLLLPGLLPPAGPPAPRRLPARLRRSPFVRRDLRAAIDSALATVGVLGLLTATYVYVVGTHHLGALLLAASTGAGR